MEAGIVTNEQQLLRLLIDHPEKSLDVEEFFVSDSAQHIFSAIKNLFEKEVPINNTHLFSECNILSSDIQEEVIRKLFEVQYTETAFDHYYQRLKSDFVKFRLRNKTFSELIRESSKKGDLDLSKIAKIRDEIEETLEVVQNKEKYILHTEIFDEHKSLLKEREKGLFYTTGDAYLDTVFASGLEPGMYSTLFGDTGSGKSSLGFSLFNKQVNRMIPSIYISIEMPKMAMMDRWMSMRLQLPLEHLMMKNKAESHDHIYEMIEKERTKVHRNPYWRFVYLKEGGVRDVQKVIKKAMASMGVSYACVYIDLLTQLDDFNQGKGTTFAEKYSIAIDMIGNVAKAENCHIIGMVQQKRNNIKASSIKTLDDIMELRPTLESIKNSGAIAERSRNVLSIFRPIVYMEKYMKGTPELAIQEDVAIIDVQKQSQGGFGTLCYLFDAPTFSFTKYPEYLTDNNIS